MKKCNKCKIEKSPEEFHKHKGRKTGLTELCKLCRNTTIIEKRYGLESGELEAKRKLQDNRCAICNSKPIIDNRSLAVDHCHQTGKVRGLLCVNCNNGLGRFKDSIEILEQSIKYLKYYENK